MQNGEIAGVILSDQFTQKFLADGKLAFDDDFKCIHAVASALCEQSPITVKKITRAHAKARKWLQDNPEETVKIMLEKKWASCEPERVLAYLKIFNYDFN